MMMRLGWMLLLLPLAPLPALAAETPGLAIAAVVGEEAVSSYDVEARLRFIIATTKLTDNAETQARVRPQVLRSLIDERLQLQEAARNKIEVSDDDVNKAIAGIEQQRGMEAGGIAKMLTQARVPKDTFLRQMKAQLSWNKLIMKKIRPTIRISDEEVALAQKRLSIPVINQELEIALITLPVDKPAREAEMRALGEKLVREVRAGASFEEVSRQFSSRTAGAGGKVETFWVRPEQLDPSIAKALTNAKTGYVTDPLRTPDGVTLVKVYNTRALPGTEAKEMEVQVKDILLKLKSDASNKEASVLLSIGEEVAKNPGACEEKGIAGVDNLKDFDIEVTMKNVRESEMSPAVRAIVDALAVGQISAPFATEDGIQLYMLCGKREAGPKMMEKERVQNIILQQKMELEAQKYMRNLRRDSYVEVR